MVVLWWFLSWHKMDMGDPSRTSLLEDAILPTAGVEARDISTDEGALMSHN